jgi:hypothetical protein
MGVVAMRALILRHRLGVFRPRPGIRGVTFYVLREK